ALNPQRVWKPLPLKILKEVKQAVKEYGVRSPYAQALLEAVATKGSAGIDLPLAEDLELGYPHVVCLGSTDFYGPLPPASVGLLLPRSSAHKRKLFVVPGVIDSDYEGQIKIQVHSPVPQSLKKGDCFAQLLVLPYLSLGESDRIRQGGFGSTDINQN
uniref:dUTPase-like domain-containing protein n=1 Tax=Pseudonaja textilis TaxID=8673 RepID=A0A670Z8V0_PSETE